MWPFIWKLLSRTSMWSYYAFQGGYSFQNYGWNPNVRPIMWKLLSSSLMWYCSLCCARFYFLVRPVGETLACGADGHNPQNTGVVEYLRRRHTKPQCVSIKMKAFRVVYVSFFICIHMHVYCAFNYVWRVEKTLRKVGRKGKLIQVNF